MAGTITGLHRSAGQLFAVAIAGSGNGRSKTPTGQLKVGFELISDRCRYAPFKKSGLSYLGSKGFFPVLGTIKREGIWLGAIGGETERRPQCVRYGSLPRPCSQGRLEARGVGTRGRF